MTAAPSLMITIGKQKSREGCKAGIRDRLLNRSQSRYRDHVPSSTGKESSASRETSVLDPKYRFSHSLRKTLMGGEIWIEVELRSS
jgi:hypothetical protein